MERFRIIRPSPVLAPYVRHYWLLTSDDVARPQRVVPTGNISLLFHRGFPMRRGGGLIPGACLSGQSLSFADLVPTGVVDMIAVVFHPYGAKAFFGIPLGELSDAMVGADDLGVDAFRELEGRIPEAVDDDECIRLIESFLIRRMNPFREYNYERMVAAIDCIDRSDGDLTVSRLAETVCLSEKQFRRVFTEHVGASPKDFMRIVRFHKALFTLQNNPAMNFTALACACGYYDQAHMIDEFKTFSGYTPGQYVALCDPYSDYFSR